MAKKARKATRAAKPAKRTAAKKPAKKPAAKKPAARGKKTASGMFKPVKQSVTIRLDSDVVSWFKKKADKYQTEINSVLRNYMLKRS